MGVARIELATPAMSTQCSTTELHAHTFVPANRTTRSLATHGQYRKPAKSRCHASQAGANLRLSIEARCGSHLKHPVDLKDKVAQMKWL